LFEPATYPLSVLEQSFVRGGDSCHTALQESIQVARLCESLGYRRLWVSEHHDTTLLAGSSPEVLLGALGAATSTIRLGSGGVMLPHYSPYKVAENFSLLANLYPGRIDLGIGRAPGADMTTAVALTPDGRPRFEQFPQQVELLGHYLWGGNTRPRVSPRPPPDLPVWMLGSSPDSAWLAADQGLPYVVALFINPRSHPQVIQAYRDRFRPSALWPEPYGMIALQVLCADTEQKALALKKAADVNFLQFITRGPHIDFISPEEAAAHEFSDQERAYIDGLDRVRAFGTPEQVREKVDALVQEFGADEVMIVSNTWHFADRVRSFELTAEAFGLSGDLHNDTGSPASAAI
jgi:luciferase family oxidoreductase group 1